MKIQLTQANTAALVGGLLVLPGLVFLPLLMLGIEPPLGPLRALLTTPAEGPNVLGSAVALALVVGLPLAGGLLNLAQIMRGVRAGAGLNAFALNLLVAGLGVCLLAVFVAGIVVDQYPCWIGVPNCD